MIAMIYSDWGVDLVASVIMRFAWLFVMGWMIELCKWWMRSDQNDLMVSF